MVRPVLPDSLLDAVPMARRRIVFISPVAFFLNGIGRRSALARFGFARGVVAVPGEGADSFQADAIGLLTDLHNSSATPFRTISDFVMTMGQISVLCTMATTMSQSAKVKPPPKQMNSPSA